jgi:F-type H+-transporting ATPase subunit a
MGELGRVHQLIIPVWGHNITLNIEVVVMTWIVFALVIGLGLFASRKRSLIPRPLQTLGELIVSILYGLTEDALGKELAKTYAPLICALFMFLLLSNWIGIIPHFEEPTKDLNTTLGLGIMGFFIAHYAGIKSKGFKEYAKEYFQPIFFMMPLNVITYSLILPPFLYAFFGLFVGTIQAFVFTMLTVVYISVQVK